MLPKVLSMAARVSPPHLLFRTSGRDAWLVGASLAQAVLVVALLAASVQGSWLGRAATALVIGAAIWWNANTIAHIHMHRPLFADRGLNRVFAGWLSLLTGIPQVVWRHRHMWHHAGEPKPAPKMRMQGQLAAELALIGCSWLLLGFMAPLVLVAVWWPAFLFGMVLCQLQGHYEHARPAGTEPAGISHYSAFYNWFWFNDGYHIEHHVEPTRHWHALPQIRALAPIATSPLPPVVRMLEPLLPHANTLHGQVMVSLEQLALALTPVARFMVASHRQAFHRLFQEVGSQPARIVVVGGGLFPRTVLVLAELLPAAELVVVEQNAGHIVEAQRVLAAMRVPLANIRFVCARFDPAVHGLHANLVVLPLGLVGSAAEFVGASQCPIAMHTWWWSRPGRVSVAVSPWLLKRLSWCDGGHTTAAST